MCQDSITKPVCAEVSITPVSELYINKKIIEDIRKWASNDPQVISDILTGKITWNK